ncbi:MAG: ABC transporter ATP-binding protein [Candidatus Zixiibacteriota bacterium]
MADRVAIRVDGLTRRFGSLTAVDRLSFEVGHGDLFGLVGPDGAGKTTTLRMLAGVMRPTEGDAEILGISIARDPEGVKHHIAYMSQRFGLYADLTVLENLHFYADLYRVPKSERNSRLARLFRFSNLEPFRNRLAGQLSGGMKQKLGLSCALIHQPDVLLLDEPTFGVDPVSRRDLWLIVHDLVAQGVTVVVSTAYMDEAERFDRVLMIHEGRVLDLDTPDALQSRFDGALYAVRVQRLRDAQEAVRRNPLIKRSTVFGESLHVTVPESMDESHIRELFNQSGFEVSSIERIAPSMEDVFINRVEEAAVHE